MHGKVNPNQGDFKLLKLGTLGMISALILLGLYFVMKMPRKSNLISDKLDDSTIDNITPASEIKNAWEIYTNQEFGISFEIPKLLVERQLRRQGGYELFVRFEENTFSAGNGVGLGIKVSKFEDEIEKIKQDFETENGEMEKDEDLVISEHKAKLMQFKPATDNQEDRSIILIERGSLVISVSTTPEQIQKIIDSFRFL